ncbi:RNA polymerase sigma factor [Skeletonema marinoi]|uniref:RNA polymerase sigma factor n=1 Tax=Skeletonema marinoi TaxID=267567 RepID=A0AAD8Y2Q7_9STRA|nr:RNA polymerase sigma factor [Skeletonema marinoi]
MMLYSAAAALLLLNHRATAFQCGASINNVCRASAQTNHHQILFSATLDSIPLLESILEDGDGHINSALASAIYEWETAHTQTAPGSIKKEFSTRDGLRLVDELAREVLDSLESNNDDDGKKSTISYNDLVQEGMIALLRAMSTYTNYTSLGTKNKSINTFEQYAKEAIHSSFLQFLATTSRPIRLPASLQTTLEAANTAAKYLRNKLGKEPSLAQVAKEVNVNPEQLALYRKLYRKMVGRVGTFVSMEDGLEVYDPSLAGYVGNGLRARSDSDAVSSSDETDASSTTSTTPADVPSTLLQLNTQEDDWTRQPPERSVAPLRDVFTDTEEINNPLSYTHHFILNEELNQFLCETLSTVELEVIQLRFGLVDSKYGGRGWSAQDIGERVGMEREEVVKVASVALEKLRQAAAADDDAFVEVSL